MEYDDCMWICGGEGAWNKMTVCGYLVVKEYGI